MRKIFLGTAIVSCALGTLALWAQPAPAPSDLEKHQALMEYLQLTASPSVFDGDSFPKIDFPNKDAVLETVGPYTLHTRFFDDGWNEVTQPKAPGRYGAIVEAHFTDGTFKVSYVTLFHTTKKYVPAQDPYKASIHFPQAFSLPASLATQQEWNIDHYVNDDLRPVLEQSASYAIFLAALKDLAADPDRFHGYECLRIDNMWWNELEKRQGLAKPYEKIVRLPEGYDQTPEKKWPLILFLHGSGERGSDIGTLKKWGPGAYADGGHPLPFIIITPQCRKDHRWNPELLMQLLDEVTKTDRVDTSRIYVTGLSMGGIGSFDLAAAYPGKFAALACLSGRENPDIIARLHDIPVWLFSGTADDIVPSRYTVELAEALKKKGESVKLTLIPNEGHGGWDKVYSNPELYTWFLQQKL
jgi:predicted esterase